MKNLFFTITLLLGVLSMEAQINVDDGAPITQTIITKNSGKIKYFKLRYHQVYQ